MRNKQIVYIAGPMRNRPDMNKAAFYNADIHLRKKGYIVLNPAALPEGMEEDQYMPICLAMLNQAGKIYMLEGWQASEGAQVERAFAHMQGIETMYQEDGE